MRHLRLYIAIATALMAVPMAVSANTITIGLTGGTAGVSGSTVTTTSLSSWASYDFVTPTTDSGLQTPTTPETSFGTFSFTTGNFSVASSTSANFAAGGSLRVEHHRFSGSWNPRDGDVHRKFHGNRNWLHSCELQRHPNSRKQLRIFANGQRVAR